MASSAETLTGRPASAGAAEPPLWFVTLIFWAAFAVAVVFVGFADPPLFERQDPDSFLRIVQVRDLLAGQGWFDLVQRRMDPPEGALLHWSRLIDLPLAGLVLLGNFLGLGERLALVAWPVLMLLAMMGGVAAIGHTLGGRAGAIAALVISLVSLDPLIVYLPGDIDHHNAQIAIMIWTVACALRMDADLRFAALAVLGTALTLAIGLEMLPYAALVGAFIAVSWAMSGRNPDAVVVFGATLAVLPAALYLAAGSAAASLACDSLSWVYALPIAVAGGGVAAIAILCERTEGRAIRLVGLGVVGALSVGLFAWLNPDCLGGPYGYVPDEVKQEFLRVVTEAQPFPHFFAREPVGAVASLMPLVVALCVVANRLLRGTDEERRLWLLPALLLAMATALSFYQIRTLPFASAVSVPILGAWVAGMRTRLAGGGTNLFSRAAPVALAYLAATPISYTLVGMPVLDALTSVSDGRIAAKERTRPPDELVEGLTTAERNCFDPSAAALFAEVPRGLVLSPIFYGPTVLMLSDHDVVAGPYHRNGSAILDAIRATRRPIAEAKAIVDRRNVDYFALCATSAETWNAIGRSPDGFVPGLIAGKIPDWLAPVAAPEETRLRLWRVLR